MIAAQTTVFHECRQNVDHFYSHDGSELSDTAARRAVRDGESVGLPNASAGSYREVARRLGFKKIEVEDQTSSAGDWCLKLRGGRFMWQTNQWPYSGFRYVIGRDVRHFDPCS